MKRDTSRSVDISGGLIWLAVTCLTLLPPSLSAQTWTALAADRARIAGLATASRDSARPAVRRGGSLSAAGIAPEVRLIWNSRLPVTAADGPLWAGRGANVAVTAGGRAAFRQPWATLELQLAPTVTFSQNAPYQIFPGTNPDRSSFASPWHGDSTSVDLPSRMGDRSFTEIHPGESALTLTAAGVAAGAASTRQRWGPAIRQPLLLADNAPGIPRLFLRTAQPVATPLGQLSAELFAGTLTESRFFDRLADNDFRSISAVLLSFTPRAAPGLTLGLSRAVVRPVADATAPIRHGLDALTHWESLATPGDTSTAAGPPQEADQLLSLTGRWIAPGAPLEIYAEWARMEVPRSLRELLVTPHHTQGYTLGSQGTVPLRTGGRARVQFEFTVLEQSQVHPDRPAPDFYTGRATAHGYTQRGQLIGAAAGPGGSAQFLAADYLANGWQAGLFVGRNRWENDAMYRQVSPNFHRHDVSLFGGARGGTRWRGTDLGAELTVGRRLNYLFQNGSANPGGFRTVDVPTVTLDLRISR